MIAYVYVCLRMSAYDCNIFTYYYLYLPIVIGVSTYASTYVIDCLHLFTPIYTLHAPPAHPPSS